MSLKLSFHSFQRSQNQKLTAALFPGKNPANIFRDFQFFSFSRNRSLCDCRAPHCRHSRIRRPCAFTIQDTKQYYSVIQNNIIPIMRLLFRKGGILPREGIDTMFMTVKQTAEKWGLSDRRVRILCAEGKIPGHSRKAGGGRSQQMLRNPLMVGLNPQRVCWT